MPSSAVDSPAPSRIGCFVSPCVRVWLPFAIKFISIAVPSGELVLPLENPSGPRPLLHTHVSLERYTLLLPELTAACDSGKQYISDSRDSRSAKANLFLGYSIKNSARESAERVILLQRTSSTKQKGIKALFFPRFYIAVRVVFKFNIRAISPGVRRKCIEQLFSSFALHTDNVRNIILQ